MRLFLRSAAIILFAVTRVQAGTTTIEFNADPNPTDTYFPSNGYGSNAPGTPDITVQYSADLFYWDPAAQNNLGYAGLGGGTGSAVYSNYSDTGYSAIFRFEATAPGTTVTLDSFNLAQYDDWGAQVKIYAFVSGGSPYFYLSGETPAGGTGFTTYSPNLTGDFIQLDIFNLFDVGINEITFTENTASAAVPEPSSFILAGLGGLAILGTSLRRRLRAKTAA